MGGVAYLLSTLATDLFGVKSKTHQPSGSPGNPVEDGVAQLLVIERLTVKRKAESFIKPFLFTGWELLETGSKASYVNKI